MVAEIFIEHRAEGVARVVVRGGLDLAFAGSLIDAFGASPDVDVGGTVVVDLAECDFIDSSGLAALLHGVRACDDSGGRMVVVASHPRVRRMFEITAVDEVLNVVTTLDAALSDC